MREREREGGASKHNVCGRDNPVYSAIGFGTVSDDHGDPEKTESIKPSTWLPRVALPRRDNRISQALLSHFRW